MNGGKTKGQNRAIDRRQVRAAEKNREPMSRGKMMGAVCRRNYGYVGPADGGMTFRNDEVYDV